MKRIATTAALSLVALSLACSGPDGSSDVAVTAEAAPDPLASFRPSPEQEAAVVAALQLLFDALESGDPQLLRSVMDPTVVMHFSETRDGETTFGSATVDGLAERIASSDVPLIERMWDASVWVDGSLATIWTPYDFYVGTEFSHCGVDVANLQDTEDGWKVVALSWTRQQPPACDLHPAGPPG